MAGDRPEIQEPIKREVRQRCGFGCVLCGFPLYQYDHIIGWAATERHVASEITLLCAEHHNDKTMGFLPAKDVEKANENPFNRTSGTSKPYTLRFSGDECRITMGTNQVVHFFSQAKIANVLLIDGAQAIKFEQEGDHLLLSMDIYERGGDRLLQIDRNELVYATTPWDIERVGTKFTFRGALRKILAEIDFDPPTGLTITRGTFAHGTHAVRVEPGFLYDELRDVKMSNSLVMGCPGWALSF